MKRILCVLLLLTTILAVCPTLCMAAPAENPDTQAKRVTVFGDSIAAGYGLEDFVRSDNYRSSLCFAGIVARETGAEAHKDFHNFACSGWTSSQVLESIQCIHPELLRNSDLIIISSGANEVMDVFEDITVQLMKDEAAFFEENGVYLDFKNSLMLENSLFSMITDPSKGQVMDKILDKCSDANAQKSLQECVTLYEQNIREMVRTIRAAGSKADIVFVTPYNPAAVVQNNPMVDLTNRTLEDMRDRTKKLSDDMNMGSAVYTLDLLSEFDGQYPTLTNILKMDIHPNKDGHRIIADRILSLMGTEVFDGEAFSAGTASDNNQTSAGPKEAPFNDTVIYITVGIAVLAVTLIVIHGIRKRRNR